MKTDYLFPELLYKNLGRWNQIPAEPMSFIKQLDQKENDKNFLKLKRTFLKWIEKTEKSPDLKTDENQQLVKEKVITFFNDTLNVDEWVCRLLDNENYQEVTRNFSKKAKELIKDITFDEIFQALRNIWVIIALQIYMDVDVELTDAMFAYSMLYPLTDNYLDNPDISHDKKKSFNERFYWKIKSNIDEPANDEEKLIFSMIDLIEADFPRDNYPGVFKALLTILDGQKKSLEQHDSQNLNDTDLLHYTFYKGGASVLADAYLVRGELSESEADFAYSFGIILQLGDDLQDIREDLENHHNTPYNQLSASGPLDDFYIKHENLIKHFMKNTFQTSTKKQLALYQLVERSLELLLFGGVCRNKKCFSRSFLKNYWQRSLFTCRNFTKLNDRIKGKISL
jgi:hypothetical protein